MHVLIFRDSFYQSSSQTADKVVQMGNGNTGITYGSQTIANGLPTFQQQLKQPFIVCH